MVFFSPHRELEPPSPQIQRNKPPQNWGGGGAHFLRWRMICTALMFRRLTHAGLKAPPDHTGRRLPLGEKKKKLLRRQQPKNLGREETWRRWRMRGGRERSRDGEKQLPAEGNVRGLSTVWCSPSAPNQSCWLRVCHGRK